MESKFNKELFTEKIKAGSRTYFIDVKETKNKDKYIVISETKKEGENFTHHRIMIYEEDILKFVQGLSKALSFLNINIKMEINSTSSKEDSI